MPPASPGVSNAFAAKARDQLLRLLGPLVAAAGYDLEDVSVSPAGRRSVVRVTVDRDGGIDLDAVAAVSRIVSDALDADAGTDRVLSGAYVLEVSSPGVDRPLTEPRHWRRAAGRLVRVRVVDAPLTGRVIDVDDECVTLDLAGVHRRLAWAELGHGRVQVEFNRAEDPDVEREG